MTAKKRSPSPGRGDSGRNPAGPENELVNRPFQALAELKAALKQKSPARKMAEPAVQKTAPPQGAEQRPEGNDLELFQLAMSGAVPLRHKNKVRAKEPPDPAAFMARPQADEELEALKALTALVDEGAEFDLFHTDEYLEGRLKKLAPEVMDDLRLGKFAYQDHLDLHGYTVSQAEEVVADFILKSIGKRYGCVLLVHGRGLRSRDGVGVLKHNLEAFLLNPRVRRHVLAFTTARAIDGGPGASYVLLKV